jgi:exosortase H (IPTLxxWG-CTERM-specific)
VLFFACAALVQFGLLLAPWFRPAIDGFSSFAVRVASAVINLLGGHSLAKGASLVSSVNGFGVEMKDGCNGVNVVILLWSAVLAFPGSIKWKSIGLLAGALAVQSLNFVRFISLFYLGQYSYSWFEFAHLYLWETLILLDGLVFFGLWVKYTSPGF